MIFSQKGCKEGSKGVVIKTLNIAEEAGLPRGTRVISMTKKVPI
jgi:hypothetical protein